MAWSCSGWSSITMSPMTCQEWASRASTSSSQASQVIQRCSVPESSCHERGSHATSPDVDSSMLDGRVSVSSTNLDSAVSTVPSMAAQSCATTHGSPVIRSSPGFAACDRNRVRALVRTVAGSAPFESAKIPSLKQLRNRDPGRQRTTRQ